MSRTRNHVDYVVRLVKKRSSSTCGRLIIKLTSYRVAPPLCLTPLCLSVITAALPLLSRDSRESLYSHVLVKLDLHVWLELAAEWRGAPHTGCQDQLGGRLTFPVYYALVYSEHSVSHYCLFDELKYLLCAVDQRSFTDWLSSSRKKKKKFFFYLSNCCCNLIKEKNNFTQQMIFSELKKHNFSCIFTYLEKTSVFKCSWKMFFFQ